MYIRCSSITLLRDNVYALNLKDINLELTFWSLHTTESEPMIPCSCRGITCFSITKLKSVNSLSSSSASGLSLGSWCQHLVIKLCTFGSRLNSEAVCK